jgi:hypothetical protein
MTRRALFSATVLAIVAVATNNIASAQNTQTIFTDADATVRVICRNDQPEADCLLPRGEEAYVRVHDQNALDSGYWHFDLSDLDATAEVTSARFQLDMQTNSWGDTAVAVFAITDTNKDWDLNSLPEAEITGENAPAADWSDWLGDPDANGQQRFNSPTPFLEEGIRANAVVRQQELPDVLFDQDPITDESGNSYGGYAGADGPGTGGSADNDDNIWPIKNAIDIDITDLVQWKLGQNAAYSDFEPTDRELTMLVRTDFGAGDNGFARFIVKESLFLGGEEDLQPGRIVVTSTGGAAPELQAGDSNQDLKFDQVDLVQVQIAAKYLTGQAATWGEGDWNGAPGGSPGSPPTGDGLFNQVDIVASQVAGKYLTGPYAAVAPGGTPNDGQTSIIYNPATGEVGVDAPAGTELTSVNIDSAGAIFTGDAAANLGGSFDNDADNNIFKATFGSSFGSLSFGNVAQAGLSQDFVLNDLTVIGSLAGGGDLGAVDLIYVPEPSTYVLFGIGALGLLGYGRRFRR